MKFAQFSNMLVLFSMILLCDADGLNIPDRVECVDINEQPALDHPELKNHTIWMSPSFHPFSLPFSSSSPTTQMKKAGCPNGTIPMIITEKEKEKRPKRRRRLLADNGHEHAVALLEGGGPYVGAKASINVWQPQVESPEEFSLAQMWVLAGLDDDVNSVEAGWHVDPDLNGDTTTRFFIYWTSDGYRSQGCYNLRCPGFVQTSNEVVIGGAISPVSTYHGSQWEISVFIWKDPVQKSWWLSFNDVTVGYWPGSLFTDLADGASAVEWGGEVTDTRLQGKHTSTPMGSGHFAEEGFGGASYISNLQVAADASTNLGPPPPGNIRTIAELPGCYNIKVDHDDAHGSHLLFGGPGRNPYCP